MRILLSFSIIILFAINAFGTTYTAILSGDWEAPSTWSGGNMPPDNIPVGDSVIIGGFLTVTIQTSNIVNEGTITIENYSSIETNGASSFSNNATITLDTRSVIQTNDMSIFTNNATITLNLRSVLGTYNTSSFSNRAAITLDRTSFLETFDTSSFANEGTINIGDYSVIGTWNTSSFTNEGTINIGDHSVIGTYNTSSFSNNATITLDRTSFLETYDTSSFFTCGPAPIYSDNPRPTTGTNGSRIFDNSGGTATLAPLPSCTTPIPTLSEWGLILLSMSLSILGIVGIRQRVLGFK